MAKTDKEKSNPILWTLFAIIIPLVIVLLITGIILNIAGFNTVDWVREKGSELPVISNFITTEEEKMAQGQIERMTATINSKDEEIMELNNHIAELETTITDLEDELLRLEQAMDSSEVTEELILEEETVDSLSDIAKTYEEMKSKNAAAILQAMEIGEANLILQEISNDARGDILQEMDTEIAAELTRSLMDD